MGEGGGGKRGRPEEAAEDPPRQVPPSVSRVDLHRSRLADRGSRQAEYADTEYCRGQG